MKLVCPNGHHAGRVPILYGYPSIETMEAMKRGDPDLVIGGCVVTGDDPEWACRECGEPLVPEVSREVSGAGEGRSPGQSERAI